MFERLFGRHGLTEPETNESPSGFDSEEAGGRYLVELETKYTPSGIRTYTCRYNIYDTTDLDQKGKPRLAHWYFAYDHTEAEAEKCALVAVKRWINDQKKIAEGPSTRRLYMD